MESMQAGAARPEPSTHLGAARYLSGRDRNDHYLCISRCIDVSQIATILINIGDGTWGPLDHQCKPNRGGKGAERFVSQDLLY